MVVLDTEVLRQEQRKTLETSRVRYGLLAKPLFATMDLLHGSRRSWSKCKVLEIIARSLQSVGACRLHCPLPSSANMRIASACIRSRPRSSTSTGHMNRGTCQ